MVTPDRSSALAQQTVKLFGPCHCQKSAWELDGSVHCVPLGKKSAEASRTPRLHKSPPPQPWAHHHHPHHQRKLSPRDSINETIAIETGKNIVRCRETKKKLSKGK